MKFIGREQEKKRIEKVLQSEIFKTIMIYGRRRIGKSALVKEVLKNSEAKSIYYECRQTSEESNVKSFLSVVSEQLGLPTLGYASMEDALQYLFKLSEEKPFILVIDEYPYLQKAVNGMDSILQVMIDQYKDSSQMKLIILGSYVDVMKSLIEEENPLYGRLNVVIDLKPMDYYDSQKFYPHFSAEDKVRAYSVFGGIPYYNEQIDDQKSFHENLMDCIVAPGAVLEDEVLNYIRSEISRITNANEAFEALSHGYYRFSDILANSHISSSPTLADVLQKLTDMDLVAKEAPINDENNKKKTGYVISDPMSRFFYTYIYRYSSQRNVMDPEVFYDRYIREDFEDTYVPKQFERICREYLIRQNKAGKLEEPFEKIGKYWYDLPAKHRNGEFDVVTLDQKGYIFYEAKFKEKKMTEKMIEEEIRQVKASGLNCYRYGFFSRSGFEEIKNISEDLILIPLDEMFN